jgi:GrpB-like predicted nucleotidyltransferase (UPF0157 family)
MTHGEAPIEVVPYDPAWPALFLEESRELQRVLASWLVGSIEHIGSTAVPGIAAKPIIDIMAGVSSLEASRPAIQAAASLRYCYFPYSAGSRALVLQAVAGASDTSSPSHTGGQCPVDSVDRVSGVPEGARGRGG